MVQKLGQWVDKNENLVELDTDKATVQLAAPVAGPLAAIVKAEGAMANVGEVIAVLDETAVRQPGGGSPAKASLGGRGHGHRPRPPPPRRPRRRQPRQPARAVATAGPPRPATSVMPAAALLLEQYGLASNQVSATGPGGRLLKEDVLRHVAAHGLNPAAAPPPADAGAAPVPAARHPPPRPRPACRP